MFDMEPNRLIFFGTSDFAATQLQALLGDDAFSVAAVVTKPDKPVGRSKVLTPPPVKVLAESRGIPVYQYASLKNNHDVAGLIKKYDVPVCIVVDYGLLLPDELLSIPRKGFVNIHPSALPRYRGPSPIQATLLNGDVQTAITLMQVDAEMDHGPIIAQKALDVPKDVYFMDFRTYLAEHAAAFLTQTLPRYLSGEITPIEQNHHDATFCSMITKDDAQINWANSAVSIYNTIRAYSEWPVAWTHADGKRYKIHRARVLPSVSEKGVPGTFVRGESLRVYTGDGLLEITEIQPEGKQKMPAEAFLKGSKVTHFESL